MGVVWVVGLGMLIDRGGSMRSCDIDGGGSSLSNGLGVFVFPKILSWTLWAAFDIVCQVPRLERCRNVWLSGIAGESEVKE